MWRGSVVGHIRFRPVPSGGALIGFDRGSVSTSRSSNRTCRIVRIRLVWGFLFVKYHSIVSRHAIFCLRFHSLLLFDAPAPPPPRAFFRPDRIFPSPSAQRVKTALLQRRPKARPLRTRARRQVCGDRVVGRARIQGSPAIAVDHTRTPRVFGEP